MTKNNYISKQQILKVIRKLGQNNLTSGNSSEEHKLIRTGYNGALVNLKEELKLEDEK